MVVYCLESFYAKLHWKDGSCYSSEVVQYYILSFTPLKHCWDSTYKCPPLHIWQNWSRLNMPLLHFAVYPFPCNPPPSYLCMLCSRNSPVHYYTKTPVRSSMAMWWKLCFLYLCFVGDIIPSYYWLSLILLQPLLNTTENRTNVNDIKSTLVATGEGWQFNNARWQVGKLVASTSFASCFVFLGSSTAPISVRSSYTHIVSGWIDTVCFGLLLPLGSVWWSKMIMFVALLFLSSD